MTHVSKLTSEPAHTTSAITAGSIRRAAVLLVLIGAVAMPATYWIAQATLGHRVTSANTWLQQPRIAATLGVVGVVGVAMLSLVPLWLARRASPAQQLNAQLGHVILRLLLTAGGLIGLLLALPQSSRLPVALFGLGTYVLTWAVDFLVLFQKPADSPHKLRET